MITAAGKRLLIRQVEDFLRAQLMAARRGHPVADGMPDADVVSAWLANLAAARKLLNIEPQAAADILKLVMDGITHRPEMPLSGSRTGMLS